MKSKKSKVRSKKQDTGAEPTAHPKGKVVILGDKPKAKKKAKRVSPSSRVGGIRAADLRETAARGIKAKRK